MQLSAFFPTRDIGSDPGKIRDMAKLTMAFEKLQDLGRGVDRLRTAAAKAGDQRYSLVCREFNLPSESIDPEFRN